MIPPIGVKIYGRDTLSPKLSQLQKKLNKFGQASTRVGQTMSAGLTAPMGLFGYHTLKTAGDFEYGMNRVSAITSAVGKDFDKLRKQAKHLGETTTFTAGQVTEGMQMLAQAGMKPIQIYDSIGTVLKGAQANMVDMASTANIGAGLMKTFGYEASQMETVMDMLTKTSMSSMTNFTELSEAFLYAGPTAGAMGKTLKETSSVLGILANGMMKSSMAGTSLRGMMAKLTAPSKEAIGIMTSLGIKYDDILDSKGNLKSFIDVIKAFETTGITAGQVLQIFGLRAGPGFQIMLNQGSGALQKMNDTIGDFAGVTEKISNVQMAGFRGQMWALTSAFQGFEIAIADSGVLVFATKIAKKITELFRVLGKFHPRVLKISFAIGMLSAVIGPLLLGIGMLSAALAVISWPIVLAVAGIAALTAGISALVTWWDKVIDGAARFGQALASTNNPIGSLIWGAARIVEEWDKVVQVFKDVYKWLNKGINLFSNSALMGVYGISQNPSGEGALAPIDKPTWDRTMPALAASLGMTQPKAQININIPNFPKGTTVTVEEEGLNTNVDQGFGFWDMKQ